MIHRPVAGGLPVDQLVLEVADPGGERAGRVALGIKVQIASDQRQQPLRVGRIVD